MQTVLLEKENRLSLLSHLTVTAGENFITSVRSQKIYVVQWRTRPILLQQVRGKKPDCSNYVKADCLVYSTIGSSRSVDWWWTGTAGVK